MCCKVLGENNPGREVRRLTTLTLVAEARAGQAGRAGRARRAERARRAGRARRGAGHRCGRAQCRRRSRPRTLSRHRGTPSLSSRSVTTCVGPPPLTEASCICDAECLFLEIYLYYITYNHPSLFDIRL